MGEAVPTFHITIEGIQRQNNNISSNNNIIQYYS